MLNFGLGWPFPLKCILFYQLLTDTLCLGFIHMVFAFSVSLIWQPGSWSKCKHSTYNTKNLKFTGKEKKEREHKLETLEFVNCHCSSTAFNEREDFWLQCFWSLPCVCVHTLHYLHPGKYNRYKIAHPYNAANTHATCTRWWPGVLMLLSLWRQSDYSEFLAAVTKLQL